MPFKSICKIDAFRNNNTSLKTENCTQKVLQCEKEVLSCEKTLLILPVYTASLHIHQIFCTLYKAIERSKALSLSLSTSFSTDHHCSSATRRNTDVCASYVFIPPEKQAGDII